MTTEKLVAAKVEAMWEFLTAYRDRKCTFREAAEEVWDAAVRKHITAPSAQPELRWPGVEVVQADDGNWDARTSTHYFGRIQGRWMPRSWGDSAGCFESRDAAIARLNDPRTPPPPHVAEKPANPVEPVRYFAHKQIDDLHIRLEGDTATWVADDGGVSSHPPRFFIESPDFIETDSNWVPLTAKPAEVWPRWFTSRDRDHRNGTHDLWRMTSPTEGRYWYGGHDSGASLYSVPQIESWSSIIELTPETCPALADARREWRERQGKASDAPNWSTGAPPKPGDTLVLNREKPPSADAVALACVRSERDQLRTDIATLTAERDRLAAEVTRMEAENKALRDDMTGWTPVALTFGKKKRRSRAAKKPGRARRKGTKR